MKQQKSKSSRHRLSVLVAGGILLLGAPDVFASYTKYTNLIVNGTFDSGSLSPWTRNTTVGRAGKQGHVSVGQGGTSYVHSALASQYGSYALAMQSYDYPSNSRYYNSTDTYVIQSFVVEERGTYLVSLDYAGRGHNTDSYWDNATSYVRLYKGTDICAAPVFEGAFTPMSKTVYSKYESRVRIDETGTYTIQLLRPEPTDAVDTVDKAVVIDNVTFALDDADNLIRNGRFDAGSITGDRQYAYDDADTKTLGFQQGKVGAGYNNPGWISAGCVGLTKSGYWVAGIAELGAYACFMQTYNYLESYGNSTDAYIWQTFEVPQGGKYCLSFDYIGRNLANLFGGTAYVRLYKGTDRTATPVYEGSVQPSSRTALTRFIATVNVADADIGTYTLEFFQPQPATATSGGDDKTICIDNVSFVRNANLIDNGGFDSTPAGTGWSSSGSIRYAAAGVFVYSYLPYGIYAATMQTYHYPASSYGMSEDASLWQSFAVPSAGFYVLSFDYAGRYNPQLFGATAYVRIHSGVGTAGEVVWEDSVVPATAVVYSRFRNHIGIPAAGTYTLEFRQSPPLDEGGLETDRMIVLDNVKIVAAGIAKTALWTGAVDDDVTKTSNWAGGMLPDADTVVFFTGDFAAQIPAGSSFACAEIVCATNASLTADCDWSGVTSADLTGTLDVKGHRLVLSRTHGDGTITSSIANGVVVISNDVRVANSLLVIAGGDKMRVEKSGTGVYVSEIAQRYSGGTVVRGGTMQPIDPSAVNNTRFSAPWFKAFGGGRIAVETGATFDLRGEYGYGNVIDLAGGKLTNTDFQMTNFAQPDAGTGTLQGDSQMYLNNNMVWGGSGGATDLRGYTLQVTIGGVGKLWLCNQSITNGTLDVVSGGWLCTTSAVDASSVTLKAGCALNVGGEFSVQDYEAKFPYDYNDGSAALKVYGTFTPSAAHNYFYGCTMQDGSTIDLSGQSGAWSVTSAFTHGKKTVDFADNATVRVKLGARSLNTSQPVIAWTAETRPENLSSLTFVRGDVDRRYGLAKKDDGLYVYSGTIISIR